MTSIWCYPQLIAHRGAGHSAPENTLAAFKLGYSKGFNMFECDVKLSCDGTAFLLHDDTLDRTTDAFGYADLQSWQNLQSLDAGAWHSPKYIGECLPTLTQIAKFVHNHQAMLNIEIKPSPNTAQKTGTVVANLAASLWKNDSSNSTLILPLLSSFSEIALNAAQIAQPHLPRALLVNRVPNNWELLLKRLKCTAIVCEVSTLTKVQVQMLKAADYYVLVYTCNDNQRAVECLNWGVNSIITDNLDLLK
jgi:glycerophosphoryl diester phosphodiesterase